MTDTERKLRTRIKLLNLANEVLAEKLAAAETAHAAKLAYIRELEDANTPEITALTDRVKALEADAGRYQWLSNYLINDDCQHDDAIVAAKTVAQLNDVINRLREALAGCRSRTMVAEMDMNDRVLSGIDRDAAQRSTANL